jgi:hypothetical protein
VSSRETPVSAGGTHAMAVRATSCSDHPRVGGEQALIMPPRRSTLAPTSYEPLEGVIPG